ncbi:MAG TPA: CPBP family intramembrane glutamic endopeptidase [Acidimicrobiales bacterium]|nr:CPBP family intramembrane glutamic endopeptidase [Acidimicrobiales bacterium]
MSTDPRPGWLSGAVAGYLVGLFVSVLAESAWAGAHGNRTDSLGALVTGTVGLWVGLAGAPLWVSRTSGSGSPVADFGLRLGLPDPVIGAAAGVVSQYYLVKVVYLPFQSNRRLIHEVGQPAQHITGLAHGAGVALLVAVVIVGAPLAEELFFRGLLLRALRARIGTPGAVGVSALAFGLAHFEPLQLPVLVLFGVVLGVLAVRTGRLGPSICAHAAFNAVAVYSILSQR